MTALKVQKSGGGLGLLNPLIYKNATTGQFTDVKGAPKDAGVVRANFNNGLDASAGLNYSVRTFNQDSSLSTNPGWDNVTGVGSPNSGWLAAVPPSAPTAAPRGGACRFGGTPHLRLRWASAGAGSLDAS